MSDRIRRALTRALLAQCLWVLHVDPGAATDYVDPTVSSCTTADCSTMTIHGTVTNRPDGQQPWVGTFYEGVNECIYFSLVGPKPDSDDGGGVRITFVRPSADLVDERNSIDDGFPTKVLYANSPGWWTVLVQNLLTDHLEDQDFTLLYARYPQATCF